MMPHSFAHHLSPFGSYSWPARFYILVVEMHNPLNGPFLLYQPPYGTLWWSWVPVDTP